MRCKINDITAQLQSKYITIKNQHEYMNTVRNREQTMVLKPPHRGNTAKTSCSFNKNHTQDG